jgi:tetratricopeptide (TPR) repeat protein
MRFFLFKEETMRLFYIVITLLVILSKTMFSGELTLTPEKPVTGDDLIIKYKDTGSFQGDTALTAFVYLFSEDDAMPLGHEVWLEFIDSLALFKGSMTVPQNMNFALFKIGNENKIDDNKGSFWDIVIFNEKNIPAEGAEFRKAVSYLGTMPDNYKRQPNFIKAIELLESEVKNYPKNVEARIGLATLQYDLKTTSKGDFESELKEIISERNINYDEGALTAVARAYRTLNMTDKADELEEDFISRNPTSMLAQEKFTEKLGEATSFDGFVEMIVQFLKYNPTSLKRDMLISVLSDSYLQLDMYKELMDQLATIENVPASIYSDIAKIVAEKKSILPLASDELRKTEVINLMNKALAEAKKEKYLLKPKFVTDTEWMNSRKNNMAVMLEEYGNIHTFYENYEMAEIYYTEAKGLLGDNATKSLFDALVMVNFKQNNFKKAYDLATEAITESKSSEKIEQLFPRLFKESRPKDADMTKTLDSLKNYAEELRLNKLKMEMLNEENYLGYLKTIGDMTIDFGIVRGKVMVMLVWSSWCEPCFQPLVSLDILNSDFMDDEKIAIGAINVWERGANISEDIRKIMSDNGLELPVYIDYKDSLPRRMSISGLPTTLVFGKQGKLQFRIAGYDDEETYQQQIKDRIKLLKEIN